MFRILPWMVVKVYRMVPPSIRGHYPGFPTSTSHRFMYGDSWSTMITLIGDSKVPRPDLP